MRENWAAVFKSCRLRNGLSKAALARKAEVAVSTINAIESNGGRHLRWTRFARVAKVLGIKITIQPCGIELT